VLEEVARSGAAMNGCSAIHLSIFGMNPVANGPNSEKILAALGKLEWLVLEKTPLHRDLHGQVEDSGTLIRDGHRLRCSARSDPWRQNQNRAEQKKKYNKDVHVFFDHFLSLK